MKSVALVTEYNPFHNGHLYHANQSKSITGADINIAIMSGQFVMRGAPAFYNKFLRTRMALQAVDIVVELPAFAAISAGQYFAESAVKVAQYLNVDHLSFGSESGNITEFQQVAQLLTQLEHSPAFTQKVKEGKSYPRIISELTNDHTILKSPNNTLGVSYVRAIQEFAPHIQPWTISRHQTTHHERNITNATFASGTSIRSALQDNDLSWMSVVPNDIQELYTTPHLTVEQCFPFLKYAIITHSTEELQDIHLMNEGLEQRIKKHIAHASSFADLMQRLKTKRYTYTHLQRVLMNILLQFNQVDKPQNIEAVHILGMSQNGQQYLKQLKQQFPERQFVTNINKQNAHFFTPEIRATTVYNLLSQQYATDFNTPVIRSDA